MSERTACYAYTDGDLEDVLFQFPRLSRRLDEGDQFTVTDPSGSDTTYKIETVYYHLTQEQAGSPQVFWGFSSIGYGVSIVP